MILQGFRFGMLLQLAVGPVCLFIFQSAASSGFLLAMGGVMGVTLIDALYIAAAIYGIGLFLQRKAGLKRYISILGGLILILFGSNSLLSFWGVSFIPSLDLSASGEAGGIFLKVLILTLSNPLTTLFWVGVFSAKISEEDLGRREICLFGMGAVASTLFFLTGVSIAGSIMNKFLSPHALNLLNTVVGSLLIFFGIKTIFKSRD